MATIDKIVLPNHGEDHCPGGPDPIPCLAPGVEWFQVQVNASIGTSITKIELDGAGANENGEYETALPTYDINSDGHLVIRKDGFYTIYVFLSNLTTPANVDQVVWMQMVVDAGPSTTFRRGLFGAPGGETAQSIRQIDQAVDVDAEEFPTMIVPVVVKNGGITTTPLELYWDCLIYENGTPTARTVRMNLMVKREPTYAG